MKYYLSLIGGLAMQSLTVFAFANPSLPPPLNSTPAPHPSPQTLGHCTFQCECKIQNDFYHYYLGECQKNKEYFMTRYRFDLKRLNDSPRLKPGQPGDHPAPAQNGPLDKKGLERLQVRKVDPHSTCEQIATSLSAVLPENNGPFSETMGCIHKCRHPRRN